MNGIDRKHLSDLIQCLYKENRLLARAMDLPTFSRNGLNFDTYDNEIDFMKGLRREEICSKPLDHRKGMLNASCTLLIHELSNADL